MTLEQTYGSIFTARAAANYLVSFGIDAEAKHLDGKYKIIVHEEK